MSRSLSLATYRALSRRRFRPRDIAGAERPEGVLLWLHASSQDRLQMLCNLAARVRSQRPGLNVLATVNQAHADPMPVSGCDLLQPLESDHPDQARQFLDHWRPQMCLWAGGDLMPNFITQAARRKIPLVLADLAREDVPARRRRFIPDLNRVTLACFQLILTRDETTALALLKSGFSPERVRVAGRLRTTATPPPCHDDLLDEVSRDLTGRPVWFAAGVQPTEIDLLLEAHRAAVRLLHRLLLVIHLADPAAVTGLMTRIRGAGLRCVAWDEGAQIGQESQIVVASDPGELGLWYRVAPITFVASTFDPQPGGRNPFEAAALGSAIMHGPNPGNFHDAFARLAAVNAASEVRNAEQLAAEVVRLAAPDQAARMALDAWRVATEGSELTDTLIELIQDMLDLQESMHARP